MKLHGPIVLRLFSKELVNIFLCMCVTSDVLSVRLRLLDLGTFLQGFLKHCSLLSRLFFFPLLLLLLLVVCYLLYQRGSLIWWHVISITHFCARDPSAVVECVSILHKGLCYYMCSWQHHFFPPQRLQWGSNGDESLHKKVKKIQGTEMNRCLRQKPTEWQIFNILHFTSGLVSLWLWKGITASPKGQTLPDCSRTLIISAGPFSALTFAHLLRAVWQLQSALRSHGRRSLSLSC